jgi:hypothetical protein
VPFLFGGFLATLALGGGAAAAWYFNVVPPSPTAEKKPAIKPVAAMPTPQAIVQEGGEASGAQLKAVEDKLAALTATAAKEADDRKQLEQDYAALKNNLMDANVPQDPDQIKSFVADLVGARKKLAEINDGLAKAGIKDLTAKKITELAAGQAALAKDHDALVKDRDAVVKDRDGLAKDRDALNAAIDAALKELKDGQYLEDDPDRAKQLVEGTKNARLARELIAAKAQNAFAATPDQRLATILVLLGDRGFTDAKELASLKVYLDWIRSKDSGASPEARAKALYAEALLERNRGNAAASALALDQLSKEGEALKSLPALQTAAAKTLKELNDPAAYYLPAVERQLAAGQIKTAVNELNAGLTAFPGQPLLLLKRAQLTFDAAGPGKFDAATQKQIREDAEAARKDPALVAESFYVVGRMEERNGDLAKAEESYRAAFKLAGPGEQGDRYRAALARVLQRELSTAAGDEEETLQLTSAEDEQPEIAVNSPLPAPAQVPGEGAADPAAKKRLEESIKIAEDLIKREDPRTKGEGYMILGAAQARLGKSTEGLKNFVKGLRLANPDWSTQELDRMIANHPAFQEPDTAMQPNPLMAEKHFGRGLDFFWARRYAEAESEFVKAISYYDDDARYRYFLGMSRYWQGSTDKTRLAQVDFQKGAQLERLRHPGVRDVNSSLERVQGDMRKVIDSYRERAQ